MTDDELKSLVASLAVSQAKTDEQINDLKASQAKTDEQINDLKASQAKTDEQINDLKASQTTTDELIQKSIKDREETREFMRNLGKMVGGISRSQGEIAEEFFYNSLSDKPVLAGIQYDYSEKNSHRKKRPVEDEYDMILVNGKEVAIIEIKYKARKKDLKDLLERKYNNFKKLYPEFQTCQHHLCLASFYIDDELKQEALTSNVTVLQRKGKIIQTFLPAS